MIRTEGQLAALAFELIDDRAALSLHSRELQLCGQPSPIDSSTVEAVRALIVAGDDPLGELFSRIRNAETRRSAGATYTPNSIVSAMVRWAADKPSQPARVVDPGAGSGRFLTAASRQFPDASLVAVEIDPLATLLLRANACVHGFADRLQVRLEDYRKVHLQAVDGRTLYLGNPPYVRHHLIGQDWKGWLSREAASLGLNASKLAGLHVHFFLATARAAKPKDYGIFITAAEWLDVNYGALVRSLMLKQLGGQSFTVIEPTAQPFPDAATTAAITTFEIGARPTSVYFRRIDKLDDIAGLGGGREVHRERLATQSRWSHLTRCTEKPPEGYVELGELCRVHRGAVTGLNEVWIAGTHSVGLPMSLSFPTVTRARDVINAHGLLADPNRLRRVIDLPADLDTLNQPEREAVDQFLKKARAMGANKGYIASHRKSWWSVGLRAAAPILSTYMARRPPAFVINEADARHINVAHGLYPRDPMTASIKKVLVDYLQNNVSQRSGRTYAGGLTKFEPREMERLLVPGPELLKAQATL